jgi:putative cardiolipin synthase
MHNKLVVVDNAFAIVGGRNIGDHYFGVQTEANFRDLDIAAAGPIVREVSGVFDRFWNGDWSYPISTLVDRTYTEADLRDTVSPGRGCQEPHRAVRRDSRQSNLGAGAGDLG